MADQASLGAKALVQITVELDIAGRWGADCTVAQIHKQARDAAIGYLRSGLVIDGLTRDGVGDKRHATVVGKPRVTAVVVDEAKEAAGKTCHCDEADLAAAKVRRETCPVHGAGKEQG